MKLTVGKLKKLIAKLPDDAGVYPDWASGCVPGDDEPGVELVGAKVETDYLSLKIKLFYFKNEDDD